MKYKVRLKAEDVHHEISEEQTLFLAVIKRAVNDWRDLGKFYNKTTHAELNEFFFGGGLEDIVDSANLGETLSNNIKQIVSRIGKELGLEASKAIDANHKRCTLCDEVLPITSFYKYRVAKKRGLTTTSHCLDCRKGVQGARDLKIKKQERFLELLPELRDLDATLNRLDLALGSFKGWMYGDEDFSKLLLSRGLKTRDLLTFKRKTRNTSKCKKVLS